MLEDFSGDHLIISHLLCSAANLGSYLSTNAKKHEACA